jgi:outer membrane protein assembly factor BamD (BamD/ComL family)
MRRWYILFLAVLLGCCASAQAAPVEHEFIDGAWIAVPSPSSGTPAGSLSVIRRLVRDDEKMYAILEVKKFLKKFPDAPEREEVLNLAGLAEFNAGMYWQAFDWYKKQWEEFPSGRLSERAVQKEMEIAEAFLSGKKRIVMGVIYLSARSDGQEILNRIVEQAPGSVIAERAMLRLGRDYEDHKEYVDAVATYDRFVQLFPKSARLRDVMLMAAKAMYLSYRGRQYDSTPLIEAQQRYKTFSQLYPRTSADNNVSDILATIHSQLAESEFLAAQLYERTSHKKAAAYYYRMICEEYADTDWATRAKVALDLIGEIPANKPPPAIVTTAPSGLPEEEPAEVIEPPPYEAPQPGFVVQPASAPASKPAEKEPQELEKLAPASQDSEDSPEMPTTQETPASQASPAMRNDQESPEVPAESAAQETHSVGLYVVTLPDSVGQARRMQMADLKLAAEPLISQDDISQYDWQTHTIHLKPGVLHRIQGFKFRLTKPFVMVADGRRLYMGMLSSPLSSEGYNGVPVIWFWPETLSAQQQDTIKIESPPYDGHSQRDPRSDETLKQALQGIDVLKDSGASTSPTAQPAFDESQEMLDQ